jgi:xanthine dehydrogenase accessory factor
MDIYEVIDDYLSRDRQGAIATIIRKLGAAPREEGAKMFVGDDGVIFGTVGGGRVEAEVREAAKRVARSDSVKLLHYRMDGEAIGDEGMICGGNIDLLLEPILPRYRDLYAEARKLERGGGNAFIITSCSEGAFRKALIQENGSATGDPVGHPDTKEFPSLAGLRHPVVSEGWVVEPIVSSSILYLFGAGHVSQYVARVASMVGFTIIVIDDRAEFANAERFPMAQEFVVGDFSAAFDHLHFRGNEFVAILTRGHKYDALVLEGVMKKPTRYVGMIGSRKKNKLIMDNLKAKGFTEDALRSVHAPIGLDIDAETPEEIAVSIVAELIAARRKGN